VIDKNLTVKLAVQLNSVLKVW